MRSMLGITRQSNSANSTSPAVHVPKERPFAAAR